MKVRKLKNGGIKLTAQNKNDSLQLLKFMEALAGEDNNPNRLSLKMEKQEKQNQNQS